MGHETAAESSVKTSAGVTTSDQNELGRMANTDALAQLEKKFYERSDSRERGVWKKRFERVAKGKERG